MCWDTETGSLYSYRVVWTTAYTTAWASTDALLGMAEVVVRHRVRKRTQVVLDRPKQRRQPDIAPVSVRDREEIEVGVREQIRNGHHLALLIGRRRGTL